VTVTLPKLSGVSNFRDVGGRPLPDGRTIRSGRILRSAHLGEATEADIAMLASLGLRTIIDFRTPADRALEPPDRVPPGVDHVEIPMADPGGRAAELRDLLGRRDLPAIEAAYGNGRARAFAIQGVADMATDPHQTECYRRFVDIVVDDGRQPVLFHCSAGKDRAGWAATIVLLALGADDDTIIEHYLASNIHRDPEQRLAFYAESGVQPEWIRPIVSVHEDYVRAGLAAVESHWGGRAAYLHDALGLTDQRLAAFRAAMVA
jgi:protein-tyrosine phosphatase